MIVAKSYTVSNFNERKRRKIRKNKYYISTCRDGLLIRVDEFLSGLIQIRG